MQDLLLAVGPNAKRGIRSQITVQKAKLKDGCLVASFTESLDNEHAGRDFSVTCGDAAHPDLLAAFRHLVPHFCHLTDQLPGVPVPDLLTEAPDETAQEVLAIFTVTGVVYNEKGTGFTLIGTRTLANGHELNLTAPFLLWEEAPDPLIELLQALNQEVELGLRGKCAEAGRQLDMFQQEPPTEHLMLSQGTAEPKQLGSGVQEAEWEDVTDDQPADQTAAGEEQPEPDPAPAPEEPEPPKKRGRGRPKKPVA